MKRAKAFRNVLGNPTISQGLGDRDHLMEGVKRRRKWQEFYEANPGGIDLEWLREHTGNKQHITEALVVTNDYFKESIEKLRSLGVNDKAFLEALELGRAMAEGEFHAFDIFQIWCGKEPVSLDAWEDIDE